VSIGDGLADAGKGNVPGQEVFDPVDWMVCNTGEHVGEIGFRIDTRSTLPTQSRYTLRQRVGPQHPILQKGSSSGPKATARKLRSAALLSISSRPSSQ
jgi:hypothetical protein